MEESCPHFQDEPSQASTEPLNRSHPPHRHEDLEMLRRTPSPLLCHRRVRSNERGGLLHGDHTEFYLSSFHVLSPLRRARIPTAMRTSPELPNPTQHAVTSEQSLLPTLTNASRSPPANPWAHLSITWRTSLTMMPHPEQLPNSVG